MKSISPLAESLAHTTRFLNEIVDDGSFTFELPNSIIGTDDAPFVEAANFHKDFDAVLRGQEPVSLPTESADYPMYFTKSLVTRSKASISPNATIITAQFNFQAGSVIDWTSRPAVLPDGTLVVGSQDGKVYWLKDGQKRFEFRTVGYVSSSPAVLADGTVVVGSNDHKVYWLKDGQKRFEFETGGWVRSSPAVLADGTVVVGSRDNKVYRLKDGQKTVY